MYERTDGRNSDSRHYNKGGSTKQTNVQTNKSTKCGFKNSKEKEKKKKRFSPNTSKHIHIRVYIIRHEGNLVSIKIFYFV